MTAPDVEPVEEFRQRARTWIRANLRPVGPMPLSLRSNTDEEELAGVARDREVQRVLFDAGFAGVCFPREYGGQGLTPEHQRALNDELAGYEYPLRLQVPTMTPCAAVILEFGTDEQKQLHIPAILKGEEVWMQFLSEPSGGSDVAGALTDATRDGEEWVLNGSKIWTTGAWWSDWGLTLARTNWDATKHRGLSVFMLPINAPGVTVHRIEMLDGNREFCQEFLSDVRVPDSDRIGEVDDGWTVATRWLFYERMLYNSPFVTLPAGTPVGDVGRSLVALARDAGRLDDPRARDLIGEAATLELVEDALLDRLADGLASGALPDPAAGIGRLMHGMVGTRRFSVGFELADALGGTWTDDDGEAGHAGVGFLTRQVPCIGGGTTEMARNAISERLLGMPRERGQDRDVPFRDVPRGSARG